MPVERILVPLDLSPQGEAKLPVAEEYARAFGAELTLLHVLPARLTTTLAEMPLPGRREKAAGIAASVSPDEARARAYLETIAARMHAAGITARPLVRFGPVVATVFDVARRERAGLIIIGSNVRRWLPRLFLGSPAEAIVRRAPCPVLLVRPGPAAAPRRPAIRAFADDAARAGRLTPRSLGLRTVDVARIVGSVGRADELGADFRPLRRTLADDQRYARILDLSSGGLGNGGEPLPPVDLYKLGYGYYVLDGHRRVAAARQPGQDEISATVTEYLPVDDPEAQQLFAARRAFERATGLTQIGAARPETYARLEELIRDWAERRGLADRAEAARRWQTEVFSPVARRIRARRLNTHFPGERTADIFVRLADYRQAEAARQGREIGWDEALESFAAAQRAVRA